MAKDKSGSIANRHLYSRASFLYQAAALLAQTTQPVTGPSKDEANGSGDDPAAERTEQLHGMSRRLVTDLRAVSLKTMMRLSPSMKQTICKLCDSLLIEGKTCSSWVENNSKGGKKPWADSLVIRCKTCGGVKRFPVDASRQKRRPHRAEAPAKEPVAGEQKG